MATGSESKKPAAGAPKPAEARPSWDGHDLSSSVSLRRAPEGTLLSLPSPEAPRAENTPTLEVRGALTLEQRAGDSPREDAPDAQESGTRSLLRAFTPGVTHEHPGRYLQADDEAESELGRGGIGRVFVALDQHLERDVAIKELLPAVMEADGVAPLQAVSRFLREARVTGQLEHPNIVPVYELGKRADGTLYYTMRVVRGRTLSRAIAEAKGLDERLPLVNHFSGLCQAIAYAHSRGVVHRDIKPDNVMIGEFGETVVLDWGMAKLRGPDSEESGASGAWIASGGGDLTLEGSLCGTPLYMSPEQALGRTRDVDERSDVWSLGVVLYTILGGRTPFAGRSVLEIVERVKAGRYTPLVEIDPRVPPELAAVAERALRPAKHERYATARELARDIQAYQAGARVGVYEYSSWELLKRFVARQRAAVVASALGVSAVLGLGVTAYQRVVTERDRAVLAEHRALTNERAAKENASRANQSLGEVLLEKADQALAQGEVIEARVFAAHALALDERPAARGILSSAAGLPRLEPIADFAEARGCAKLAFTFEGRSFACARGNTLALWSSSARRELWTLGALPAEVVALAFAPARLAVALSDGAVELRELRDGTRVFERRMAAPTSLAVSLDGALLAAGSRRGSALLWEVEKPGPGRRLELGESVSALAFAKQGAAIAVGGELGALALFPVGPGKAKVLSGHSGTLRALAFADRGRYLASAGADRAIRFWDVETGLQPMAALQHSDAVTSLSWSEDKRHLAFGAKDRSFGVVDLRGGARKAVIRQHDDAVELVLASPDLEELVTFSRRDGLTLWSLGAKRAPPVLSERGNVLALALLPAQQRLASAGLGQNGVCLWNVASAECSTRLPARMDRVRALAASPDERLLALAGSGREVFLWDLASGVPRHVFAGHGEEARALAFSADGRLLVSGGLDRKLLVHDVASGKTLRELPARAGVQALAFAGATHELVAGDRDGTLSFWDASTGLARGGARAHDDWVLSIAVAPDGRRLATAGADRRVRVWDASTRARLLELTGHEGKVFTLDYSRDGALIASAGEDKSIRVWDALTGRELAVHAHAASVVRAVRFAAAEPRLVSAGDDGIIRFWSLEELRTPGAALAERFQRTFGVAISGTRLARRAAP